MCDTGCSNCKTLQLIQNCVLYSSGKLMKQRLKDVVLNDLDPTLTTFPYANLPANQLSLYIDEVLLNITFQEMFFVMNKETSAATFNLSSIITEHLYSVELKLIFCLVTMILHCLEEIVIETDGCDKIILKTSSFFKNTTTIKELFLMMNQVPDLCCILVNPLEQQVIHVKEEEQGLWVLILGNPISQIFTLTMQKSFKTLKRKNSFNSSKIYKMFSELNTEIDVLYSSSTIQQSIILKECNLSFRLNPTVVVNTPSLLGGTLDETLLSSNSSTITTLVASAGGCGTCPSYTTASECESQEDRSVGLFSGICMGCEAYCGT